MWREKEDQSMCRKAVCLGLSICLGATWPANLGCAVFECGTVSPALEVALDSARTVKLMNYHTWNAVLPGPNYNYAELSLAVDCREAGPGSANVVARRGSTFWWGVSPFEFGKLEGRTDQNREKVWIVDTESRSVVASLDRATRATTGPGDEPPAWADPTGGILLKSVEGESANRGAATKDPTPSTGVERPNGDRTESLRIDAQADAALRSLADCLAHADGFSVEAVTMAKRDLRGRIFKMRMVSEIAFARPNKLAIISESTSTTLNGLPYLGERPAAASVVCDGTNLWIRVSGDPTLARKPAPEAFDEPLLTEVFGREPEFAGGFLLPALVHRDPYELLTRACREISYEGVETCEGMPCHRLRMVHDTGNPMFLWISAGDTPLPRKFLRPAIPQRMRTIRGVRVESGGNPEVIERYWAWKVNVQPPEDTFSIERF
jgi:hypothetical protein